MFRVVALVSLIAILSLLCGSPAFSKEKESAKKSDIDLCEDNLWDIFEGVTRMWLLVRKYPDSLKEVKQDALICPRRKSRISTP